MRVLPYLLVFALGAGAAGLTACGTTKTSKALIPAGAAGTLKSDLDAVVAAVDAHQCPAAEQALARAQGDLDSLPGTTSVRLRARLQQGIDTLKTQADKECVAPATTQETIPTTSTATTDTATTDTTTTTTPTNTTPTLPTTTTPSDTTPTTTPPVTTPGTPGDGTGGVTTP